eukprot:13840154-Alexandrium_andersonii.AAC.1
MGRREEGQTNGQSVRLTDGLTDRRADRWTEVGAAQRLEGPGQARAKLFSDRSFARGVCSLWSEGPGSLFRE